MVQFLSYPSLDLYDTGDANWNCGSHLGIGGTYQCLKTQWKDRIIEEKSVGPAPIAGNDSGSKPRPSRVVNRIQGSFISVAPTLTRPTSADSMDAEMWYPNKKQWPVIWTAFLMAAILFIGGVSNDEPGVIAASFCVLVLGALLVWKFSSTD